MPDPKNHRLVYLGNLLNVAESLCLLEGAQLVAWLYENDSEPKEPFQRLARKKGFPTFEVKTPADIERVLGECAPLDLGIIANFGIVLNRRSLKIPRKGFVNAHLGLLPENPGRHPIRRVVESGESITGVTLHRVTPQVDRGPVLAKKTVSVGHKRDSAEIFCRLCDLTPGLIRTYLPYLLQ